MNIIAIKICKPWKIVLLLEFMLIIVDMGEFCVHPYDKCKLFDGHEMKKKNNGLVSSSHSSQRHAEFFEFALMHVGNYIFSLFS